MKNSFAKGKRDICLVMLAASIVIAGCGPTTDSRSLRTSESPGNSQGTTESESNDATSFQEETPSVDELIDQLVDVGAEGVGFHSTAWSSGFAAIDEEPEFRGGVIGSEKPVVSEPVRELVKRGVHALPGLIEHLSDERETHLTVATGQGIIMAQWHSDEYHPRYRDPSLQPTNVNTEYELWVDDYRLKVGDLCYVTIGQIVNRDLSAVRYQPSGCRVINSPIHRPALAAAVRADWSGLTEEQHRESLIQDALATGPFFPASAIKRLHFYYPERGEELAVKLLNRHPYDSSRVGKFVYNELLEESDPSKWKDLISEFRSRTRAIDADAIPLYFSWMSAIARQHGEGSRAAEQFAKATKILEQEYPDFDMNRPHFINSVSFSNQSSLIDGISSIKSDAIDAAALDFFERTVQLEFAWERPIQLDDLAMNCMERLIGKGHDDVFLKYCDHRIEVIEQTAPDSTQRYRLDSLKEWAVRLQRR